ncbi:MAG: MBL fold metallo-hydrolase [Gemmatimonadales bacterium]
MSLDVTFWGTRGSIPTPGPGTARYGGNTACLTLLAGGERLVLDGGTGLRALGKRLVERPGGPERVRLLLSHTHWDHIQGIPFFRPLYQRGAVVEIFGPAGPPGATLGEVLTGQMAAPVFPVPASAVAAELVIRELASPALSLGPFAIRAISAKHPAPTLGYAVSLGGATPLVSYLTDNDLDAFDPAERRDLVATIRNSALLIHDAMYFEAEAPTRAGWGHSTAKAAVRLAAEAGAERLALFHHDPDHDDPTLERLLGEAAAERDRLGAGLELALATEGATIRLETP